MLRRLADPEFFETLAAPQDGGGDPSSQPVYGTRDPLQGLVPDDLPAAPRTSHHRLLKYLRREVLPTTFCVGCGGGTVLNETSFSELELEKMRVMFRWHLNVALENECSATYQENIDELSAMSKEDWMSGKAEEIWQEREPGLDEKFRELKVDHYVGKKYVNMLWAEEYGYDLT